MSEIYIGQEVTEEKIFDKKDVVEFAKITGDNNPLHLDEEYAKHGRFGKPIVHGVLIIGFISKIIGTQLPGCGSIYLEQNAQFRKPVYIGEKVIVKVKVAGCDRKVFKFDTNVFNENGDCVISGTAKVLYEGETRVL